MLFRSKYYFLHFLKLYIKKKNMTFIAFSGFWHFKHNLMISTECIGLQIFMGFSYHQDRSSSCHHVNNFIRHQIFKPLIHQEQKHMVPHHVHWHSFHCGRCSALPWYERHLKQCPAVFQHQPVPPWNNDSGHFVGVNSVQQQISVRCLTELLNYYI